MSKKKPDDQRVASVPPFGLRMLPDLRDRIKAAAEMSGRSMNSEIVARLESSFERYATEDNLPERIEPLEDTIKRELDEFEQRLRRLRMLAEKIEDPDWKDQSGPATR